MVPGYGKFELEQPATIAAASIKQPAIEIFEIFTPFIAPLRPLRRNYIPRLFSYRADVSPSVVYYFGLRTRNARLSSTSAGISRI
jgi:hypothetical protein